MKYNKIYIIDDDQELINSLEILLQNYHYDTRTSTSARSALKEIPTFSPHVIILDWQMPEMNGIEFIEHLQSIQPKEKPYIIMVSGRKSIRDIVFGLDSGADDYLPKPFEPSELLARIRVGIRIRTLEEQIAAEAQKSALLQMALSVADSIGNPIAAAKLYVESLLQQSSLQYNAELQSTLTTIHSLLTDALKRMNHYQSITSTQSIPPPSGGTFNTTP